MGKAGTSRLWGVIGAVILAFASVFTGNNGALGQIIYVDDDGPADFNNIQAAIDDANDGDTLIVEKGLYFENINFKGRNIVLVGTDAGDPSVVASTIIDGLHLDSVVTFAGTEDADCLLSGFTIRYGHQDGDVAKDGGGICGGSEANHTRATIYRNFITSNQSCDGGGISFCDGLIQENIITDNYARCWRGGGGLYQCNGIIRNNIIAGNHGGGCESGSAISSCDGIIENNTITRNFADGDGVVVRCSGTIRNCIIWGNTGNPWTPLYSSSTPSFSCIQGWDNGGSGNIDADPCFADPCNGDFHLKSRAGRWDPNDRRWTTDETTSPCIDAANPMTPIGHEPFPNGGITNMGAYGRTAEASKSYFGKPPCEIIVAGDINGDCIVNFLDFRIMALHWLEDDEPDCAVTTTYRFVPDPHALGTSGGLHGGGFGDFCIEGRFDLTVDSFAGTAWFENVDANAGDMCGEPTQTFSLDELYHMSELTVVDMNEAAIDFLFEANNPTFPGADVNLRAIFLDDSVQMVANVCDAMYDGYCYHLNAVAVREE